MFLEISKYLYAFKSMLAVLENNKYTMVIIKEDSLMVIGVINAFVLHTTLDNNFKFASLFCRRAYGFF